ncbi:unnamed protein product [Schistosoma rodhaini]|nr:unnamed protein product [Schistosoma rodhaini]
MQSYNMSLSKVSERARRLTLLMKTRLQLTEKAIVMRFLQLEYLPQALPMEGFWKIMGVITSICALTSP